MNNLGARNVIFGGMVTVLFLAGSISTPYEMCNQSGAVPGGAYFELYGVIPWRDCGPNWPVAETIFFSTNSGT